MTFKTDDRVYETSTTTGTGTYSLAGAVTGFQAFSVMSAGNDCPYFATDDTNWEVGIGTIGTGPATLARTAILGSSNAGSAVSWGSGTRKIRCGLPAAMAGFRALSKSVAGSSNVTLTQDEQRRDVLVLTGVLTGNISVIVDTTQDEWTVYNNTSGAYSLTVKTAAGSGKVVPQGKTTKLRCDGTNVIDQIDALQTLTLNKGSTGDHLLIGNTMIGHITENGTSIGLVHTSSIATGTGVSLTATTASLQVAGSAILAASATGVVLSGTLTGATSLQTGTGTGNTAGLKTINGSSGAGSGYFGIYAENITPSGTNFGFAGYYDGSISFQNAVTTAYMSIAAAAKVTITAGASSTSGVQLNAYTTNGTVTTTGGTGVLSSASDARLKQHDEWLTGGLGKLRGLRGRYYYWLHDLAIEQESEGHLPAQRQLGFFAQDVNEHLGDEAANPPPDWNPEAPWGYYDRSVLAVAVDAINELKVELDSLRAEFAAYKAAHA